MPHSLLDVDSVYAKLGWADEHAKTVKNEVKAWNDTKPYSVSKEHNADFTRYSLIAHIANQPDLRRWSLIVGDAVHNLRCALDHLVYTIAIYESGQNPPPDEGVLQFPICDTCPEFTKAERKRLGTLSDPVRAAIEASQPYHRPHPSLPPILGILRDFDNGDKHKLLRLASATVAKGDIGFHGPDVRPGTTMHFVANYGEIKDGTEIAAYIFDRPTPDMKFDRFDFLLVVALWHRMRDPSGPLGSDRTDLASLLTTLIVETQDAINRVTAAVG